MSSSITSLIESWDGIGVVTRYDKATGSWMFVALHDDTLGMPSGGTRMKTYPGPGDALLDAMRLAAGMTHKWAAIDLEFGGGKAVLAVPGPLDAAARHGLLSRYGRLLASLHGSFATGPDLGTTPDDMLVIGRESRYVHGVDVARGMSIDPGPFTALGVLAGIQGALHHRYGTDALDDRMVLVQGVGDVGDPLARLLSQAGANLILSDLDAQRASRLAEALGDKALTIDTSKAYGVECDVYAPCAIGGTLNDSTIPALNCRIVAGSANNQLESERHAEMLAERGILYAPDYIVNAGGAIALASMGRGDDEPQVRQRVNRIADSLREILREAEAHSESPVCAANRIVQQRLEAARTRT